MHIITYRRKIQKCAQGHRPPTHRHIPHILHRHTHTDKHIYTNIKGTAIILIIKNVAKYLNYIVNYFDVIMFNWWLGHF